MSERDHEALSDILGVLDRALVLAPLMSCASTSAMDWIAALKQGGLLVPVPAWEPLWGQLDCWCPAPSRDTPPFRSYRRRCGKEQQEDQPVSWLDQRKRRPQPVPRDEWPCSSLRGL